mmetsp:Transcript_8133/g.17210  ORF Transcript_8133/g.17210 Transcript_8133/m.17210 type:complete len:288 (+) Transcript_8133:270-1133(+)
MLIQGIPSMRMFHHVDHILTFDHYNYRDDGSRHKGKGKDSDYVKSSFSKTRTIWKEAAPCHQQLPPTRKTVETRATTTTQPQQPETEPRRVVRFDLDRTVVIHNDDSATTTAEVRERWYRPQALRGFKQQTKALGRQAARDFKIASLMRDLFLDCHPEAANNSSTSIEDDEDEGDAVATATTWDDRLEAHYWRIIAANHEYFGLERFALESGLKKRSNQWDRRRYLWDTVDFMQQQQHHANDDESLDDSILTMMDDELIRQAVQPLTAQSTLFAHRIAVAQHLAMAD